MSFGMDTYHAWVTREIGDKQFETKWETRSLEDLPPNDTLIRVEWSCLNYKDALSYSGNKGITRNFPHTTGVDAAGEIVESASPSLTPGQNVMVIGFDLGMNTPGGHGQYIRVPSEWVIPIPDGLQADEAMVFGTAGFTAAQSLYRIRQNALPTNAGEVLVTGATGGVGSVAVALLAEAGYEVVACTRQRSSDDEAWLKSLGARQVVSTDEVLVDSPKPMLRGRWAGAVDTVGGPLLDSILKTTDRRAVVTCCGMIGGDTVNASIFPFILRGVSLIGIDSAECPMLMKKEIWTRLAREWKPAKLGVLRQDIGIADVPAALEAMLAGQGKRGRVVVKL